MESENGWVSWTVSGVSVLQSVEYSCNVVTCNISCVLYSFFNCVSLFFHILCRNGFFLSLFSTFSLYWMRLPVKHYPTCLHVGVVIPKQIRWISEYLVRLILLLWFLWRFSWFLPEICCFVETANEERLVVQWTTWFFPYWGTSIGGNPCLLVVLFTVHRHNVHRERLP